MGGTPKQVWGWPTCRDAHRNAGYALIAVVMYLGVVALLSSVFVAAVNRQVGRSFEQERLTVCRMLAEGGVEKALAELQRNPAYAGESDVPLGDGVYSVMVEPEPEPGVYRIRAVGELSEGEVVRARVRLDARASVGPEGVRALAWLEERHR